MVRQETPLRRWWREESWCFLAENPDVPIETLATALELATWVAQPGVALSPETDYSGYLQTFLQNDIWQEEYQELLFTIANGSIRTRTPLSAILRAYDLIYARSTTRELCMRVRRNQGAIAVYSSDVEAAFAYTRDVMALLPEADFYKQPEIEVTIYLQRSTSFLLLGRYDQALHHALHAATLGGYHAGGIWVMNFIAAHVALCAALDDRCDMAAGWLERLGKVTRDGDFTLRVVEAVMLWKQGDGDEALIRARQTLACWPVQVVRRVHAYLAQIMVVVIETILMSKGVASHDIGPEIFVRGSLS